MQKLTLIFIYGSDENRRLKYRVTDDMPVGVMIEKLIGFQFVIDCADPTTFQIMHNGQQIKDLSKTFEECSISDGDEIYLIPTVFEPIPPIIENDAPIKRPRQDKRPQKKKSFDKEPSVGGQNSRTDSQKKPAAPQQKRRRPEIDQRSTSKENKPASYDGAKSDSPVPFKPKSRNYYRTRKKPGSSSHPPRTQA